VTTDAAGTDEPIRVLLVDDHDAVALGLRALLEDADDIDVVAIAGSVADAITAAERHTPQVVLVDYRLPDGTGADLTRALRETDDPPAVVMISGDADRRVLGLALEAGCVGFVSKQADRDDLVESIRAAAAGDSYFTRDMLKHLAHLRRFDQVDAAQLADREIEVLQLTADGMSPDEIAEELFLSPHTVKNHLRHAMAKLDAHTKLDAVVKAVRARLISIDR
jgi:DNA-binding NarL/FixJ family response regulator